MNHNFTRKRLDKIKLVWQALPPTSEDRPPCFMRSPTDCTFLRDNHFVIADSERHSLLLYDAEHLEGAESSQAPKELARCEIWPNGVASLPTGNVVVTDRKDKTVKFVDVTTGKVIHSWTKRHMDTPSGIAVARSGHIIATDIGTHTVNVLSPEGRILARGGGPGSEIQELNLPFFCAVDKNDNIVVSDNMNFALKIYDPDAKFLQCIGSGGEWGRRQFQCPYGVAIDPDGNILAADNENDKVFMFNSKGEFDQHLLVRAHCYRPSGIAFGPYGRMLITENAYDHLDAKLFQVYEIPKFLGSPVWKKRVTPYKTTYI